MNQRIRELIKQAQFNDLSIDTNGDPYDVKRLDPEKFAELIIQDCIDLVNKRRDAAIDAEWHVDEAMSNAVWDIEENFGIEQ